MMFETENVWKLFERGDLEKSTGRMLLQIYIGLSYFASTPSKKFKKNLNAHYAG